MNKQVHVTDIPLIRGSVKIPPITVNYINKPKGGIWTSSWEDGDSSDWIKESLYRKSYRNKYIFEVSKDAKILHILSYKDVKKVHAKYGHEEGYIIYERVFEDYDAVHVSYKIARSIDFPSFNIASYYSWSVESSVFARWVFDKVEFSFEEPIESVISGPVERLNSFSEAAPGEFIFYRDETTQFYVFVSSRIDDPLNDTSEVYKIGKEFLKKEGTFLVITEDGRRTIYTGKIEDVYIDKVPTGKTVKIVIHPVDYSYDVEEKTLYDITGRVLFTPEPPH